MCVGGCWWSFGEVGWAEGQAKNKRIDQRLDRPDCDGPEIKRTKEARRTLDTENVMDNSFDTNDRMQFGLDLANVHRSIFILLSPLSHREIHSSANCLSRSHPLHWQLARLTPPPPPPLLHSTRSDSQLD